MPKDQDAESLKARKDAAWGALASLPHMDAIFSACEALEAAGESLNRDRVREASGITRNNTLAEGLRLYRERRKVTERYRHTPPVMLHVIANAIETAYEAMHADFEQDLEVVRSEAKSLLAASEADLQAEEDKTAELQERFDAQTKELERVQAALAESLQDHEETTEAKVLLERQYTELLSDHRNQTTALTEERSEKARLSTEWREDRQALLDEFKASTKDIQTNHREQLKELKAQHESETARLMSELGNNRSAAKQRETELQTQLTTRTDALSQLNIAHAELTLTHQRGVQDLTESTTREVQAIDERDEANAQVTILEKRVVLLEAQLKTKDDHIIALKNDSK